MISARTAQIDEIGTDVAWREVADGVYVDDKGAVFVTDGREALIISTAEK
jgi:hypothetical protein